MNEAKLPSLAAVCEVMIDAMRRAEQTPKEESKMTDHKLPPISRKLIENILMKANGEDQRDYEFDVVRQAYDAGYRAGQSSVKPTPPAVPKEWLSWLRGMEWHGWQYKRDGDGAPTCSDCGAFQEDGHKESCELAKLLAASQRQSTGDQGFADGVRAAIAVIESHKIPVGNSAAGEMACEWTYEALKEICEKLRELDPTPPT